MVILIALLMLLLRGPAWHQARAPGDGCWPPRCRDGQMPLATPVVAHAGRLYMIGDGAIPNGGYESVDGTHWHAFDHDAGWGRRYQSSNASYRGSLWRVGGFVQQGNERIPMNDVWRSDDARHWTRVVERAPWAPRANAHLIVFKDTMWLIGGESADGRVWTSVDGVAWFSREAPGLPPANPQGVVVWRDSLWILGHGAWQTAASDVWSSADGRTWTQQLDSAAWGPRTGAGFASFDGRLWVIAGAGKQDAWWTLDGRRWQRHDAEMPGPPRGADYSVVFQNAVWVFGGKTGGAGGTGFWDGIVYLR